ncbi:MAG TPA: hypothetical protein VLQ80_10660 [Candidatus Saccharimonadia bacterium]|nr:hypothetical protein [Candidatus Saccharimonadia bacterium]
MTKVGLCAIGKSTTLESNKSLSRIRSRGVRGLLSHHDSDLLQK